MSKQNREQLKRNNSYETFNLKSTEIIIFFFLFLYWMEITSSFVLFNTDFNASNRVHHSRLKILTQYIKNMIRIRRKIQRVENFHSLFNKILNCVCVSERREREENVWEWKKYRKRMKNCSMVWCYDGI